MKTIHLTPYTLPDNWSDTDALHCTDPSLAVQSERDECDINTIVKRFGLTGNLPYGVDVPAYDDYSMIPSDYHQALNFVMAADDTFMEMPASVRSRFDNDAGKFLDFVNNDSNYDEAIALGLVLRKPSPEPSGDGVSPDGSGDGTAP